MLSSAHILALTAAAAVVAFSVKASADCEIACGRQLNRDWAACRGNVNCQTAVQERQWRCTHEGWCRGLPLLKRVQPLVGQRGKCDCLTKRKFEPWCFNMTRAECEEVKKWLRVSVPMGARALVPLAASHPLGLLTYKPRNTLPAARIKKPTNKSENPVCMYGTLRSA